VGGCFSGFLRGFLRKHGARMWFFDGVIVVGCVVNVVKKHHQNRPLKNTPLSADLFFDT
jgi:hypothetical protein